MHSFWHSIIVATVLMTCAIRCWADPPPRAGWETTWFDEFDGSQVDTSIWDVISSTSPTNNSLQAYLPQQVTVAAGNLQITSVNQPFGGLAYRSGQVISKAHQQYGRWEVRARLPTSRGMWPAIWLLPDVNQYAWPSQGEIDIMENRGDQPNLTSSAFHWGTNPPFSHSYAYQEQQAVHGGSLQNYHNAFHTYAVEWEPSQVRFYVDDVQHFTVHDSDTGGFLSQQTAGMEIVLNTAVGGDFLANPDGTTVWPQQFLIDYVRVYEAATTPAPLTFENGGFENGGGTLANWSTFGNSIPNVQTNAEAIRSGNASLKVFGQFNGSLNFSGVEQGISVSPGEELRAIARSFVRSVDSISGTDNELLLKIDYYNQRHGRYESSAHIGSQEISIANGSSPNNVWLDHELRATTPSGAVEARLALVFRQPASSGGAVHVDDVLFGRRGDYTLDWDGSGDGDWNDQRWTGAALDTPTDFDNAVIRNDRVRVTSNQTAFQTTVQSGTLDIQGNLASNVNVEPGGMIVAGVGPLSRIDGALDNAGVQLIDQLSVPLIVTGMADVDGARLLVSDVYQQQPGTLTDELVLISAATMMGSFATPAGMGTISHLGHGHFLHDVTYSANDVRVEIYAALPGDANGDLVVDGSDFIIWNTHKFQSGTDWLSGDFNGDGLTDGVDFVIWNANKFTSAVVAVPEPSTSVAWLGLVFLAKLPRRPQPWHFYGHSKCGSESRRDFRACSPGKDSE